MQDIAFAHLHDDRRYRYFDGKKWRESGSGEYIEVRSPIDQSLVGIVAQMSRGEIDEELGNLTKGQKQWVGVPLEERAVILKKTADLMRLHADELAHMQTRETGKLIASSRKDIDRSADIVIYVADQLEQARGMMTLNGGDFSSDADSKTAHIERVPHGVVLAISPFNYPINLAITKIAPALLMGNSVILKAATQGTLSCAMLVDLFVQAGLPEGVIGYVTGSGSVIGDYLVAHPGIDAISFTGSTAVGHQIAKTAGMKPLQLELGGKDAALVLPDADLDLAASEIVKGAFSYSGQRCTAIKRVLVHADARQELVEKITSLAQEQFAVLGDPLDAKTQLGPLISSGAARYAIELLEDAQAEGAVFRTGGVVQGQYMEATVVDRVTPQMRLAWEEQFAPILPIISCQDEEEMITLHNKSRYGLGASIFTSDMQAADRIAAQLEVGVIQINAKSERYPDHFPFLGIKDSGLGVQGIHWSLEAMSRIKSVVVNK